MEAHERAALIHACALAMKPTVGELQTIRRDLDHAAVRLLLSMPLAAVRRLPPALVEEAATLMLDSANPAELAKLSKKWEPNRTPLDESLKQRLRADLASLVRGGRTPYVQPSYVSPTVARTQPEAARVALREAIHHLAPLAHLQALHRQWAPGQRVPSTRSEINAALLQHLEEPSAPAPREPEAPAPRGRRQRAAPVEEPAADAPARVYEPVKGKPHRRKYRDAKGEWQYEDVPMQKAGERRAEYLLRLMRYHLGEM